MTARNDEAKTSSFEVPEEAIKTLLFCAALAYQKEDYADALAVYEGVAANRPKWSRPVVGMGISLYGLGRVEAAEAAYRRALEIDERDQEAHLYLGELVWNERRDAAECQKHLGKAFEIQPKNMYGVRARFIISKVRKDKAA